ncbi:hypothetical protein G5I_10320 [Acromyrmex echinatior]|uniref:Uncharacterized protein n=1 Tax=Acromyrmex echinatior TaxID=103372 RepID=F4WWK6_ACREC|nr:hypothetical protein G5I_10320 [Acromyrmex echinatior]
MMRLLRLPFIVEVHCYVALSTTTALRICGKRDMISSTAAFWVKLIGPTLYDPRKVLLFSTSIRETDILERDRKSTALLFFGLRPLSSAQHWIASYEDLPEYGGTYMDLPRSAPVVRKHLDRVRNRHRRINIHSSVRKARRPHNRMGGSPREGAPISSMVHGWIRDQGLSFNFENIKEHKDIPNSDSSRIAKKIFGRCTEFNLRTLYASGINPACYKCRKSQTEALNSVCEKLKLMSGMVLELIRSVLQVMGRCLEIIAKYFMGSKWEITTNMYTRRVLTQGLEGNAGCGEVLVGAGDT